MLKHDMVKYWYVKSREDGHESGDDSPEQELVVPNINGTFCEVLRALGLHFKERTPHIDHLPGQEKG